MGSFIFHLFKVFKKLRINKAVKRLVLHLAAYSAPITRIILGEPVILMFHGVIKHRNAPDIEQEHLHIPADAFDKICCLIAREYEPLSLDELIEIIIDERPIPKRGVVITFDDGYRNNLSIAQPILDAWNLPFTVYVSTRNIDTGQFFPTDLIRIALRRTMMQEIKLEGLKFDLCLSDPEARKKAENMLISKVKTLPQEKVNILLSSVETLLTEEEWQAIREEAINLIPMNWDELKCLSERGASVGAHCHDHCLLHAHQSEQEVLYQLQTSRSLIEQHLGTCGHLAYPNGSQRDIASAVREWVKESGYLSATTTIPGTIQKNSNPFYLPRMMVTADPVRFKASLPLHSLNSSR